MRSEIIVQGNDSYCGGTVSVVYTRDASISPLHLDFTREDGYSCSMSLTHEAVKELLKLVVDNL